MFIEFSKIVGAFFPSLLYSNIEGQKTTFIFSELQNLLFLHSSTKSESPPTIVEGLWNRDAEKQKRDPLPHSVVSPLRSYANYCAAMRDYTFLAVQMEIEW